MRSSTTTSALRLLAFLAVVAALHAGRPFLVPICMAGLLALLLGPLVSGFQRRLGLPRIPAVLGSITFATALLVLLGWFLVREGTVLAEELPAYRENFQQRVAALRGMTKPIADVSTKIEDVKRDVEAAASEPEEPSESGDATAAQPASPAREVPAPEPEPEPQVAPVEPTLMERISPFLESIATLGAVLILALFLLIYAPSLRDRIVQVLGPGNLSITTQALDEATGRVSSYLFTTLMLNAAYGIPVGIGLHWIGLPGAIFFGLAATLLRFIPYVGPWTGAALPILFSLAVFPTWGPTLSILGLFLVLELITENVIEPLLYGKSSGLSTFAVLVAAFFWAWLWGGPGLVLAVPLTLCLAVAGRYVPELSFLHVLLAADPSREHHTHFFRRIMAFDGDGARRLAARHVEERGPVGLLDDVVLPALALAEQERRAGTVDASRQRFLHGEMRRLLDGVLVESSTDADAGRERATLRGSRRIAIVPSDAAGDGLAARALGQLVARQEPGTVVLSPRRLVAEHVAELTEMDPSLLVVVALPPGGAERSSGLLKRLRARFPNTRLVLLAWSRTNIEPEPGADPPELADRVVHTAAEALAAVRPASSREPVAHLP
ncbi:MAG: AI-2E family transporter [Planctomycetes bacterium]|nr:AI-2E family transporter [Planctomycetota bacterium]